MFLHIDLKGIGESRMLKLTLKYDVKNDSFEVISDIKKEKILEVALEFLRTQMGKDSDDREATEREVYEIDILLDLETDEFHVSHNANNDSLMTGILARFVEQRSQR